MYRTYKIINVGYQRQPSMSSVPASGGFEGLDDDDF